MRVDKAKNLAKVAVARAKNPLGTVREIGEEAGVDPKTVCNLDKELPQISTKSNAIQEIIEQDLETVKLGAKILLQRMKLAEEDPQAMSNRDIISATDTSAKRYSLFKGSVTDKDGGLKEIQIPLTSEQQSIIAQRILDKNKQSDVIG